MKDSATNQVDVIVLSWNRTEDTIAAIASALAQNGVSKRVIVVDQGSTAENLHRLRSYAAAHPEVTLVELAENVGVPEGRNIASGQGNAPCIVALDNDAVFPDPGVLQRTLLRLDADPRLGAIAFRILNYFTGRDDEMCWDYPDAMRGLAEAEFDTTRFIGAGHAIRRTAFEQAGGYDGALFFGGEERDLSYRILNLGYDIRYVASLSVLHKSDPEARIRWNAGRYYYTVRNCLYTDWKSGSPWWRLGKVAASLLLRGMRNGVMGQAMRGIGSALSLSGAHPGLRPVDRLSPAVRAYIDSLERVGRGSVWLRLRRQMARLPGSG